MLIVASGALFGQTDQKATKAADKRICVTFDNLPAERNYGEMERLEINQRILDALAAHSVKAAGFVIGDNVESDWDILVEWLEDGHTLGFQTFSGQDIEGVPAEPFIGDIIKGQEALEDILQSYRQSDRYFRFPYLHYGSTTDKKDAVAEYLAGTKIKVAHATIIPEDFVYNLSMEKIKNHRDSLELVALRDEYLNHLLDRLASAETMAVKTVGRPVRHILSLRVNRVNAVFLDAILTMLEDKGYGFITLKTALKDEAYGMVDHYYGAKIMSFLERLAVPEPEKK
ncbi:MAG: polysaccharide deacetylase family protein [candidate division Zixibacteria bacterium]|nr:polysaccharide deacetylase family protein [candidate division Zixibacteria bacterium]